MDLQGKQRRSLRSSNGVREREGELLVALGKGLVDLNQVTVEGKKKKYKYPFASNGHLSAALPHSSAALPL
jgi:hypothetical protein